MMTNNEYPLYPELTEAGAKQAQEVMDKFKERARTMLNDLLEESLGDFYTDVTPHIGSDHWTNYRNDLMNGFKGYQTNSNHYYDFKELRKAIYENNKDQIVKDLNRDLVEEVKRLNDLIDFMSERG